MKKIEIQAKLDLIDKILEYNTGIVDRTADRVNWYRENRFIKEFRGRLEEEKRNLEKELK